MLVIIIFLNAGLLSATGSNTTKTSSQELELIICQQKKTGFGLSPFKHCVNLLTTGADTRGN